MTGVVIVIVLRAAGAARRLDGHSDLLGPVVRQRGDRRRRTKAHPRER